MTREGAITRLFAGRLLQRSATTMEKGISKKTQRRLRLRLAHAAVLEETRQQESAKRSRVVEVTEGDCADELDQGAQEAATDQSNP